MSRCPINTLQCGSDCALYNAEKEECWFVTACSRKIVKPKPVAIPVAKPVLPKQIIKKKMVKSVKKK